MLALIVASFHVVTRQTWQIGWAARATDAVRLDSISCHEAIAKAIADRDPRTGEARMAEHFDNTVTVLLAAGIN
jgi:GntR family transcriptional repressor for pyruvate dehydrogenase complex